MRSSDSQKTPPADDLAGDRRIRFDLLVDTVLVFAVFFIYAALANPIPGLNEPHYLGKAKHYWDPSWCSGDLFLESANAHVVFYQAVGWLTCFLSLEQTAWVARGLATLVLASGWTVLFSKIKSARFSAVWGACLFIAMAATGNLSGEWVIGGIESKVFAYGCLFWSLALFCRQNWISSAACLGFAVSFHPLVGGWSVVSALLAGVAIFVRHRFRAATDGSMLRSGAQTNKTAIVAIVVFAVASLPGLIPAVMMLSETTPELSYQATYIQVAFRLAHHLDPLTFSVAAYVAYALLFGIWIASLRWLQPYMADRSVAEKQGWEFFNLFVAAAVGIAVVGIIIGLGPRPVQEMAMFKWRIAALKFYPFRLMDVLLPIAVCMSAVAGLHVLFSSDRAKSKLALISVSQAGWAISAVCLVLAMTSTTNVRHASKMEPEQLADWLDMCHWIREQTPDNALVCTPMESWAFKWFADRPEYVSYKDCPQDAASLVEWNRRLLFLRKWAQQEFDGGYDADELVDFGRQTDATYLLVRRLGPMKIDPAYRNGTYRLYEIRPSD